MAATELNQCREWSPQLRKIFVERDIRERKHGDGWGKNRKRVLRGGMAKSVSKFLRLCLSLNLSKNLNVIIRRIKKKNSYRLINLVNVIIS